MSMHEGGIEMQTLGEPLHAQSTQSSPPSSFANRGRSSISSMESLESNFSSLSRARRIRKILVALILWAPWQLFVSLLFISLWVLLQIVLLPLRCADVRYVILVQRCFARVLSSACFLFVTTNTCESCYGCDCRRFESYDDFLQSHSASRRKNIRRNFKRAQQTLRAKGISIEYFPAGEWKVTAEHRALIWDQCHRHSARSFGYADILNCWNPVPPFMMYVGELMLTMAFPCDVQLFKDPTNKVVSLNTRVHTGDVYYNPNYASLEEYSREGIYPAFNWHMLHEALRLRANFLNVMPSLRSAKGALGLQPLHLRSLMRSSCSCVRRRPRSSVMTDLSLFDSFLTPQENDLEHVTTPMVEQTGVRPKTKSHPAPKGGKRAARKRAAAEKAILEEGTQDQSVSGARTSFDIFPETKDS